MSINNKISSSVPDSWDDFIEKVPDQEPIYSYSLKLNKISDDVLDFRLKIIDKTASAQ
jgi:hypothetical protein